LLEEAFIIFRDPKSKCLYFVLDTTYLITGIRRKTTDRVYDGGRIRL